MTARERVTKAYEIFVKEYGEEMAQSMLTTLLVSEQEHMDLTYDEANALYDELHKNL